MIFFIEIGTKIKQLRENREMSQNELANKIGIAQTTLGSIESGETKKVDFLLMDKICKEFNVGVDYFTSNGQNNNVKNLNGSINNHGTINLISEEIIQHVKYLTNQIELKDNEIKILKSKLK